MCILSPVTVVQRKAQPCIYETLRSTVVQILGRLLTTPHSHWFVLLQDGASGFCVHSGDEASYVERLRRLVEDKDLRSKVIYAHICLRLKRG